MRVSRVRGCDMDLYHGADGGRNGMAVFVHRKHFGDVPRGREDHGIALVRRVVLISHHHHLQTAVAEESVSIVHVLEHE